MRSCSLITLTILALAPTVGAAEAPRWLSDFEEAKKLAREGGKPIFVVFRCEH